MAKKFNMTIELSAEDIKQAVAEYISRNLDPTPFHIDASSVTFIIEQQRDMRGEPMGSNLTSAKVKVTNNPGSYQDR
jgi:hypothetical protein